MSHKSSSPPSHWGSCFNRSLSMYLTKVIMRNDDASQTFPISSTKHVWYNAQVSKNSLEAEEYPNYFSVGHCFGEWVTSTKFREFVFNKTNWMTWLSTNVVGPSFPSSSHHPCQHHHHHHQLTIGQHEGWGDCRAPSRSTRSRCSSPSRSPAPPAPSSYAPGTLSGQIGFARSR